MKKVKNMKFTEECVNFTENMKKNLTGYMNQLKTVDFTEYEGITDTFTIAVYGKYGNEVVTIDRIKYDGIIKIDVSNDDDSYEVVLDDVYDACVVYLIQAVESYIDDIIGM